MMGATQTTLYIQGNYLDINKHRELLDMLQSKNIRVWDNNYIFTEIEKNEYEINQIINSLDPNAFIRISSNPSFTEYREYRSCKPRWVSIIL